jgi:energy-coupling factor transporter ATP-binding protein EcfA2
MRPGRALAIARVRLVGFHNFVDATITLSVSGGAAEAGERTHLFLVGDNGSGKSTLLDAIHTVLTGADTELNAAARVGPRDRAALGRTLAGIVLRQRDDRAEGRVREGHSVAYAAMEVAGEGERWTFGVGLGATTLEAPVTRWGFVHRGGLEAVPLTKAVGDGGRRPVTADELAASIGEGGVHRRIGDYRARIAELFFGGEVGYEQARRVWAIAKAHREIAASTREPSELVTRFLPAPRSDALAAIRTSLAHLDALERDVAGLDTERARVAGIVACQGEIAALRRERRTIEARQAHLALAALEHELAALDARRAERSAEETRAIEQHARAEEDERVASTALAAARTGAAGAWIAARDTAQRTYEERRAERERAEAAAAATRRAADEAAEAEASEASALSAAEERARVVLRAAVEEASTLPWLLPRTAAFARGTGDGARAREELVEAVGRARRVEANARARVHETAREAARAADEEAPTERTAGIAGLDALRAAGVEACTLDRAIEPRADAPPSLVAALEALVPRDVWETIITTASDVPRARTLLAAHPGARLAAHGGSAALPMWVAALLAEPATALAQRGMEALAHELAPRGDADVVAPPDALGCMVLRGACVRGSLAPARLGEPARVREREARAAMRARRIDEARQAEQSAASQAERAQQDVGRLEAALSALDVTASGEIAARRARLESARARRELASAERERAEQAASALGASVAEAERALAATHEPPPHADGADALRGVARLEAAAARARRTRADALDARVAVASARAELERRRSALEVELTMARARAAASPWGVGAEGETITLDALARAHEHAVRAERARLDELLGDGSRGIRLGAGTRAPLFAHVGEHAEGPLLEDASGRSPASVLAELDRQLAELRQAAGERARDVFDGVVVGSLATQLQREVEQLHATVTALNEVLGRASYGPLRFAFRVTPRPERAELVSLVRRMSVLDPASRGELRRYVEERRSHLVGPGDEPPELLDYRRWFDVRLVTRRTGGTDSPWTRERAATGSGGERGVPSHLVVLALARLVFDGAHARLAPLMLDEAFHGIDVARREALLAVASDLALQLVVASPDQDGAVPGLRSTTTLFVVKDEHDDVQAVPYHYYDRSAGTQTALAV